MSYTTDTKVTKQQEETPTNTLPIKQVIED